MLGTKHASTGELALSSLYQMEKPVRILELKRLQENKLL